MNEKVFRYLERFYLLFIIISRVLCWEFTDYYFEIKNALSFSAMQSIFFGRIMSCIIILAFYIGCFILVKRHYSGERKRRFLGGCIIGVVLVAWDIIQYLWLCLIRYR